MSDDSTKHLFEALEEKKARLLREAAAEIERAMAEERAAIERLAAEAARLNLRLVSGDGRPVLPEQKAVTPAEPAKRAPTVPPSTIETPAAPASTAPTGPKTFGRLVELFRKSTAYVALRHNVRTNYDNAINRLVHDIGTDTALADLNKEVVASHYNSWVFGGKLSYSFTLMQRLRQLFIFGAAELDDVECQRLSGVLRHLKVPNYGGRTRVALTPDLVIRIRQKAHEKERPSIALAQALQYELRLSQRDVIGEWVPNDKADASSTIRIGGSTWQNGLLWEWVDANFILRFPKQGNVERAPIDLKHVTMVMEEISRLKQRPTSGPMILSEFNGFPYNSTDFRRWWRLIADAAGVDKEIRNMDVSRGRKKDEDAPPKQLEAALNRATEKQ